MPERTRTPPGAETGTSAAGDEENEGARPEGDGALSRDRGEDLKGLVRLEGLFAIRRLVRHALAHEVTRRDLLSGFYRVQGSDGRWTVHLDLKDLPRLDLARAHGKPRPPGAALIFNAAEHERRWAEARERASADGRAFDGEREEWGLVLDALREAQITGRISAPLARRLADALEDTFRGRPPVAWTRGRRGHPVASRGEEAEIAAAQDYVRAVRADIIEDRTPSKTVRTKFKISKDTYSRWMREEPAPGSGPRPDYVDLANLLGRDKVASMLATALDNVAERYRKRRRNPKKLTRDGQIK